MTPATASLVDVLVGATTDVFETMVFRQLQARETDRGDMPRVPRARWSARSASPARRPAWSPSISRSTPPARSPPPCSASRSTRKALPDAVGEVTNMIAGAFRTRMAAFQDAWAISVPTVTVGSDFYIKPISDRGSGHRRLPHGRARTVRRAHHHA